MVLQRIKLFFYNNLKLETPSPLNSLYTDDETILVIVDGSTFYQIFPGSASLLANKDSGLVSLYACNVIYPPSPINT